MTHSGARRRKGVPPQRRRDNTPLLIGGGVVAIIVVAMLVFLNVSRPPTPGAANTEGRVWGNKDAKVTIDEWSDFQ